MTNKKILFKLSKKRSRILEKNKNKFNHPNQKLEFRINNNRNKKVTLLVKLNKISSKIISNNLNIIKMMLVQSKIKMVFPIYTNP